MNRWPPPGYPWVAGNNSICYLENMNKQNHINIASACLCGFPCRWDGSAKTNDKVMKMFEKGEVFPICPEILAGLETPREPCEILFKRIVDSAGNDYTDLYLKGIKEALKIVKNLGSEKAYLKSGSPTCGAGTVYNGSFSNKKIEGYGKFAELLKGQGIDIEEIG